MEGEPARPPKFTLHANTEFSLHANTEFSLHANAEFSLHASASWCSRSCAPHGTAPFPRTVFLHVNKTISSDLEPEVFSVLLRQPART